MGLVAFAQHMFLALLLWTDAVWGRKTRSTIPTPSMYKFGPCACPRLSLAEWDAVADSLHNKHLAQVLGRDHPVP